MLVSWAIDGIRWQIWLHVADDGANGSVSATDWNWSHGCSCRRVGRNIDPGTWLIANGVVRDVELLTICILVLLQGKAQAGEGDRDRQL
jgi:hypothetical protein